VQTASGRESRQGTGLGLSISRKFAQLLSGDITVTSVVGQGSCFSVSIQVTPTDPEKISPFDCPKHIVGLAPYQPRFRLLVVEDIKENRDLLFHLLIPLGFELRSATNGQEAIALWEEWEPHLIWMDMKMPVIDGYEATRYIKSQRQGQNTIIIALTASALDDQRQVIMEVGCDDWVYKPFRTELLFEKLEKHLGVQFIYADSPPTPTSIPPAPIANVNAENIQPESIQPESIQPVMPTDWIQALDLAARSGDDTKILALIGAIPSHQTAIISELTHLANNFAFERIFALTHPRLQQ
jgi:CheY-like chemotaxis protein